MEDFIQPIIIGFVSVIAVSLTMVFFKNKANSKAIKTKTNQFILTINKFYLYLGIFSSLFRLFCLVGVAVSNEDDKLLLMLFFFLMFIPYGVYNIIYGINYRVLFDESILVYKNWKGKSIEMLWGNITDIKFKKIKGTLQLKDSKGQIVNVHIHSIGLTTFMESMEKLTPFKKKDLKISKNYLTDW